MDDHRGDPPPPSPRPGPETVVVHRTWSDVDANLIAGMLHAAGIPCTTVSDVPHSVYPLTLDGLGEVRIVVAAADAEEARRRIDARPVDPLADGVTGPGEDDPAG